MAFLDVDLRSDVGTLFQSVNDLASEVSTDNSVYVELRKAFNSFR